jgi:Tol biopolymer transport system component
MHSIRQCLTSFCFALGACVAMGAAQAADDIVFSRYTYEEFGAIDHIDLFRIYADGTGFEQLTPSVHYKYAYTPAWSPHGTYVAFALTEYTETEGDHYNIWITDRHGGNRRQVTSGTGEFRDPAWRPDGGLIAFNSRTLARSCLSVVRPDGTGQRDVFCPPAPGLMQPLPPIWSADGRSVFVAAFFFNPRPGQSFSRAYKVNVPTGTATLLTQQPTVQYQNLYFTPDGSRGIYANAFRDDAILGVDFATDQLTALASGYSPVWSHDGTRFAFSRTIGSFGDVRRDFAHVFVMNANGSNEREITPFIQYGLVYTPADWSPDDTQLLINRRTYEETPAGSGRFQTIFRLRIFDVATRTVVRPLTTGLAGSGAWYVSP